jgi:hypothetical protein
MKIRLFYQILNRLLKQNKSYFTKAEIVTIQKFIEAVGQSELDDALKLYP